LGPVCPVTLTTIHAKHQIFAEANDVQRSNFTPSVMLLILAIALLNQAKTFESKNKKIISIRLVGFQKSFKWPSTQ
jgi:hypothetical protein